MFVCLHVSGHRRTYVPMYTSIYASFVSMYPCVYVPIHVVTSPCVCGFCCVRVGPCFNECGECSAAADNAADTWSRQSGVRTIVDVFLFARKFILN